ncbi:MAG: sulfur carrier protein ThiS [Bacteroidales bacterium]|nr:sulfur carrier protein ThiS [Bacteroidales bacterium]
MNIILNNRPESFKADKLTVNELLKVKNFTFRMLVIKINGNLIKKTEYDTSTISDGDKVMVMHLVSGG